MWENVYEGKYLLHMDIVGSINEKERYMLEMINGNMSLTGFHHDVDSDKKTTTFDGLIHAADNNSIEVHVELTARNTSGDVSPVLKYDKAEPIVFAMVPMSVQQKLMEEQPKPEAKVEPEPVSAEVIDE